MQIITTSIRKERGRTDYKARLAYIKKDGMRKEIAFLRPTKDAAQRELNFRIAGLKNGGKN